MNTDLFGIHAFKPGNVRVHVFVYFLWSVIMKSDYPAFQEIVSGHVCQIVKGLFNLRSLYLVFKTGVK